MDVLYTNCDKFSTQWIDVNCQTLTICSPTCASHSTWHLRQSSGWDPLLYHYMYWVRVVFNLDPGDMAPVKRDICGRTSCFPSLFSCSFSREAHVQECTNPTGVQGGRRCRDRVWCGQLPTPNHHLETQRSRCHPEKRWWDMNSLTAAFSPEPPSPLGFPPLQAWDISIQTQIPVSQNHIQFPGPEWVYVCSLYIQALDFLSKEKNRFTINFCSWLYIRARDTCSYFSLKPHPIRLKLGKRKGSVTYLQIQVL